MLFLVLHFDAIILVFSLFQSHSFINQRNTKEKFIKLNRSSCCLLAFDLCVISHESNEASS